MNESSTEREAKFVAWRNNRDLRHAQELADAQRKEFLQRLDEAEFEVTDWEAEFMECALVWRGPFTDKMRDVIHKLECKYAPHLKHFRRAKETPTQHRGALRRTRTNTSPATLLKKS